MHLTEPKSSKYTINTKTSGNFSIFLQLINFNYNNIQILLKNSLESEDQLLKIFKSLYNSNSNYSYMYDYVEFDSVSNDGVASFIHRYNYKDLTQKVWHLISTVVRNILERKRYHIMFIILAYKMINGICIIREVYR